MQWEDGEETVALRTISAAQNVESAKPRSNTTPGTYRPMDPTLTPRARYQLIVGEGGHANTDQNIHMAWLRASRLIFRRTIPRAASASAWNPLRIIASQKLRSRSAPTHRSSL